MWEAVTDSRGVHEVRKVRETVGREGQWGARIAWRGLGRLWVMGEEMAGWV